MYANVNGVRLFFDVLNPKLEIAGDGLKEKPTLVCLPGGPGGDHQTLRPFFDRFADVAQLVYFDPRGGGRSDHGDPESWSLDQWGDDVAVFCDVLGIRKPIVLGSSGGSMMVQACLARHPDHAAGAILLNACSRIDQDGLVAGYERLGGPEAGWAARVLYGNPTPDDYAAFFRCCLPLYSRKGDLSSLAASRGRVAMNPGASRRFFAPSGEAWRFDHRNSLSRVGCPVLVVLGERDPVTPAAWGREVADALPAGQAELVVFPEASHLVTSDEPEAFATAVSRFIAAR